MKEKEWNESSLAEELREYYGGIEMRPELVEELLSRESASRAGDGETAESRPAAGGGTIWKALAAAAVIAVLALAAGVIGNRIGRDGSGELTSLAMAEVARNHSKKIPPEIESPDYAAVQAHLSRLDFSIVPSADADGMLAAHELVGGRYCKVQGVYAAQLKLISPAGTEVTAYVVPGDGKLAGISPGSVRVDGVEVRCVKDGTRLFFLAEDQVPR